MAETTIQLTEVQLRALMKETVHETLTTLGVDAENPLEMQADFSHLRDWRKSTDAVKIHGFKVLVGLFLTAIASVIGLYLMGTGNWRP